MMSESTVSAPGVEIDPVNATYVVRYRESEDAEWRDVMSYYEENFTILAFDTDDQHLWVRTDDGARPNRRLIDRSDSPASNRSHNSAFSDSENRSTTSPPYETTTLVESDATTT